VFPPLAHETSPSYPSGHALVSAAFALALVIIARETRWRWRVGAAASAYVLAVGFSRLYLGVHYPSDVLAGWCLAVAWAATASILVRQRQRASSG
jgi:undecaprenyl-diphosphatase